MFCYLQASSLSRCFRPKTARCLCVFFLAYSRSIIFYLFHDDVITHSAINLHLHFIWDLPITTGVHSALCVADNERGKIQTILPLIVCLPSPLPPALYCRSHLPRQHQRQLAISDTASSRVSNNQMKLLASVLLASQRCRSPMKLAAIAVAAISSIDWSVTWLLISLSVWSVWCPQLIIARL